MNKRADGTPEGPALSGTLEDLSHQKTDIEPAAPAPPAATLETIDPRHYDLEGEQGRGGIGRVLRARDRRLERVVAVKELLRQEPAARERFLREARITARLQHPGIVPIYEVGRWPSGEPFYSMKLVEGRTLEEMIDAASSPKARLALLPHVIAVAETMAYAHANQVIHRDLKPSNVIVGEFGETMVVDWGLAKHLADEDAGEVLPRTIEVDPSMTRTGAVLGTPRYMAPEQASGGGADARSDVFSLGGMLACAISGIPPEPGRRHPSEDDRTLPAALRSIVRCAMAALPRSRYETAAAFASDLKRFHDGQSVQAHRYSWSERVLGWIQRNPRVAILSFVSLVAIGGLSLWSNQAIVAERNIARVQRDRALAGEEEALRARRDVEKRAAQLVLAHATSQLTTDPTRSIAWLKRYPREADWDPARLVLLDALSRPVARWVMRHDAPVIQVILLAKHNALVTLTRLGGVFYWSLDTGLLVSTIPTRAQKWYTFVAKNREETLAAAASDGSITVWRPLDRESYELRGHDTVVLGMAFSPDGGSLVSSDTAGNVRIWTLADRSSALLTGHVGPVRLVQSSPDQRRVASGGEDGTIRLWDLATRKAIVLRAHRGWVDDLEFSPDGASLASGGFDGVVNIWDPRSGALLRSFPSDGAVAQLLWRPGADALLSATTAGVVRVRYLSRKESWLLGGHYGQISLAGAEDRFFTGGSEGGVTAWLGEGHTRIVMQGHSGRILSLDTLPDGSFASGSEDGTARFWLRPESGRILVFNDYPITQLKYDDSGQKAYFGAIDGRVGIVDVKTGAVLTGQHEGMITSLSPSPDGIHLASSGWDNALRVWDVRNGRQVFRGQLEGRCNTVSFSPDGRLVASADSAGPVRIWDMTTGKGRTVHLHLQEALMVDFSPDGDWLASVGSDRALRVTHMREDRALTFRGRSFAFRWSPRGDELGSVSPEGSVSIWNIRTLTERELGAHSGRVSWLSFSPAGDALATASHDRTAIVWELTRNTQVTLRGHEAEVSAVAFSPDGKLVATGSRDRTIRLWSRMGRLLRVYRGHVEMIHAVRFSPDGSKLLSAGTDGTIREWPVEVTDWRETPNALSLSAMTNLVVPE